jgi:hypothetical protein
MTRTVELPEKVWSALQQAATAGGVTPAGWIAAHLPVPTDANGISSSVDEEDTDHPEPPTYNSVPLERVGAVQVVCVTGSERPPLSYPLVEASE